MRFGLWAAAQEQVYVPESTRETKKISTQFPVGTKKVRDVHHASRRKEHGRYDIPEPKKNTPSIHRSDKEKTPAENVMVEFPIIDRIPTAIGYLSDGSDEEWLEEKSRCSRYNVSDHGTDDELDETERDEEENRDDDDLYENGNDKYSQNGKVKKKKKEKAEANHDTISALWSHSTDSDTDNNQWKRNSEGHESIDETLSYKEEQSAEPIYDTNQKSNLKKTKIPPGSPAGVSETSSASDNVLKMLHYAQSNDQQVSEDVDKNVKILKTVATEAHKPPVKHDKKKPVAKKSIRKLTKKTDTKQKDSSNLMAMDKVKSKDEIELCRSISVMNIKSKDEIELSRSVSRLASGRPDSPNPSLLRSFTSNLFHKKKSLESKTAAIENIAPNGEDLSLTDESTRSGRQSHAMYTKSLLTEDSDNEDTMQNANKPDPEQSKKSKKIVSGNPLEIDEQKDSKKHRIGILLSNSFGFAGKLRSKQEVNLSEKIEKKSSKGFFWKKREQRKSSSILNKEAISDVEILSPTGEKLPIALSSPKGSKEPQELDEYSKATKETNANEPDFVQCLRFFQCGSVANNVNVAITVANCGKANQEDDDINYDEEDDESLDVNPVTPKPTVEVYLNDGKKSTSEKNERGLACGNSMSCKNDSSENDDILTEAPMIGLSRANSIIVDVTSMQLHLDGAADMGRTISSVRAVKTSQSKSDVSVTSIMIPNQESPQDVADVERQETEMVLKDYVNKISKRKRVVSFFKKLIRRQ